jgi:anti-sigma factor RsiW
MICQIAREWIPQLLDGELDPASRGELERHLETCVNCAEAFDRAIALREKIRGDSPYFAAPPGLEARVRQALKKESAPSKSRWTPPEWWLAAAGIAAVMLLSVFIWEPRRAPDDPVAGELVSTHIRALQPGHLIDVPSSDRHTVKPWFAGKLDFSPRVEDLASKGFELKGGRLDYLHGRSAAALIYERRQHVIELFISPGDGPTGHLSIHGYNIIEWSDAGMSYWAISDLNADELGAFQGAYRTAQ